MLLNIYLPLFQASDEERYFNQQAEMTPRPKKRVASQAARDSAKRPRFRPGLKPKFHCFIDGCSAATSSQPEHLLKSNIHDDIPIEERRAMLLKHQRQAKFNRSKVVCGVGVGGEISKKRVRYRFVCVVCRLVILDPGRHLRKTHHVNSNDGRYANYLSQCKRLPLTDRETEVSCRAPLQMCLDTFKVSLTVFPANYKAKDVALKVSYVRNMFTALAERAGREFDYSMLLSILDVDDEAGVLASWYAEKRYNYGSLANVMLAVKKFFECTKSHKYKNVLQNVAWVTDSREIGDVPRIEDYIQFCDSVVKRCRSRYAKEKSVIDNQVDPAKYLMEKNLWGEFNTSRTWKDTVKRLRKLSEKRDLVKDKVDFAHIRDVLILSVILNNYRRAGDLQHLTMTEWQQGTDVLVEGHRRYTINVSIHKVQGQKACPLSFDQEQRLAMDRYALWVRPWLSKTGGDPNPASTDYFFRSGTTASEMSASAINLSINRIWEW